VFVNQILEKQKKQVEAMKPTSELAKNIDKLSERLEEVPKTIEQHIEPIRKLLNVMLPVAERLVEADLPGPAIVIRERHVQEALTAEVPVIPTKSAPNDNVTCLGLPIPNDVREQLLEQKDKFRLQSYKAAVFAALRLGIEVLEQIHIDTDEPKPEPVYSDPDLELDWDERAYFE
jgi:hypothetical protein